MPFDKDLDDAIAGGVPDDESCGYTHRALVTLLSQARSVIRAQRARILGLDIQVRLHPWQRQVIDQVREQAYVTLLVDLRRPNEVGQDAPGPGYADGTGDLFPQGD